MVENPIERSNRHARDYLRSKAAEAAERQALLDEIARLREALRAIEEGNLGDGPGQANHARLRQFARTALQGAADV